jgi:hypothetical protein
VVVAGARAALAQLNGEVAESVRLLEEATTLAAESGMPVLQARTLTRYGGFLRRAGQVRRARPYLAKARWRRRAGRSRWQPRQPTS